MEQKQEKQLSFEFCAGCGGFLPADTEVVISNGKPICLCKDCRGPEVEAVESMDDTDRMALEFAKKYNIPPEK